MKKIMIFDDEQDMLDVLTLILMKLYVIATAKTTISIEKDVKREMPDLILLDLSIPDAGGEVALQKLKSNTELKNIPVVFFSANNDLKKIAERSEADGFIMKPFKKAALIAYINQRLGVEV